MRRCHPAKARIHSSSGSRDQASQHSCVSREGVYEDPTLSKAVGARGALRYVATATLPMAQQLVACLWASVHIGHQ